MRFFLSILLLISNVVFASLPASVTPELIAKSASLSQSHLVSPDPKGFIELDGNYIFTKTDFYHGRELWITNLSISGTRLLKDIAPGLTWSSPFDFIKIGDEVYFQTRLLESTQVWKTDGTTEGTVPFNVSGPQKILLSNFMYGSKSYYPTQKGMYVHGIQGETNSQIWFVDNETLAWELVFNTGEGRCYSDLGSKCHFPSVRFLGELNGVIIFAAHQRNEGEYEDDTLYAIDVSSNQITKFFKSNALNFGVLNSFLSPFCFADDKLYFSDYEDVEVFYESDGTIAGTVKVASINCELPADTEEESIELPADVEEFISVEYAKHTNLIDNLSIFNRELIFSGDFTNIETEQPSFGLWKFTEDRKVQPLLDSEGDQLSGSVESIFDDKLFTNSYWINQNYDKSYYDFYQISYFGGVYLEFITFDPASKNSVVIDRNIICDSDFPSYCEYLYSGKTIYSSNYKNPVNFGIPEISEFRTSSDNDCNSVTSSLVHEGKLFVAISNSIFNYDGNLDRIPNLQFEDRIRGLKSVNKRALVWTCNQVIEFDNVDESASLLLDFSNLETTSIAFKNKLLFFADTGETGLELWSTDGTVAGSQLVKDIAKGLTSSFTTALEFVEFNKKVYFTAHRPHEGVELWVTDGTEAGTQLVKDINPGIESSSPSSLIVFDERLYFSAHSPATGTELWVSDGTSVGTTLAVDLIPGEANAFPTALTLYQDSMVFSALTIDKKNAVYSIKQAAPETLILRNTDTGTWVNLTTKNREEISRSTLDLSTNPDWSFQAFSDINGDGEKDVLLRHKTSGQWYAYSLSNGEVIDKGYIRITSTWNWQLEGSADFNGDGKSDLLLRHKDGHWILYFLDGRTVSSFVRPELTAVTDWEFKGAGDFNGDGKADVVVQHKVRKDSSYMYLMDDGEVTERGYVGLQRDTSINWDIVKLADMDGDSRIDVIKRNKEDGSWAIQYMNGRTVSLTTFPNMTKGATWKIAEVADFDGNGELDLLMQNSISGKLYQYFFESGEISSRGYLPLSTEEDSIVPLQHRVIH